MDHGFTIEEVHEMLDGVEAGLSRLRTSNLHSKQMPVSFISDAVSAIYELDGEGLLGAAGISRTLAIKLKNLDGKLPANVMLACLERIRTYLRRLESEFGGGDRTTPDDQRIAELDKVVNDNPPRPIAMRSETWVFVEQSSRAREIISELSELLEEVHLFAKTTNLPEREAALTDLERAQLIVLLETTLAVLKAPMVESGLLKRLQSSMEEAAKKAVNKQVEQGMAGAIDTAIPYLISLVKCIFG